MGVIQIFYDSTYVYVVNLSMREEGVKYPQNSVNIVYGCPIGSKIKSTLGPDRGNS